jgi:nucleoside-diphosphate-sugar epimerase
MTERHIVVTGGTGFIGRHVVAALAGRGSRITVVARHAPDDLSLGVAFLALDLLETGTAAAIAELEPTHLVHAAWDVTPGKFWHDPGNLDWAAASLRLFRAFAAPGRRAVFVGTCAEYAWTSPVLNELTTPTEPGTLYGVAKHAVHGPIAALAKQAGTSLAWARLFQPYGPHEAPGRLVSGLIRNLLDGRRTATSDGFQQRDFMHVADVGAAIAALLESTTEGPVNIATGTAVPVRAVIERIAALTGRADLVDWGARPTAPGDPLQLGADIARLRDLVGFRPRYDLGSGLAETVAWWRAQPRSG